MLLKREQSTIPLRNLDFRSLILLFFSNVTKLVERLEEEEEKKQAENTEEIKIEEENKQAETDSRWKNKFITIWKLNEQLQRETEESEKFVGPKNFKAIMKLGQGSFGVVYLVEKLRIDEN